MIKTEEIKVKEINKIGKKDKSKKL